MKFLKNSTKTVLLSICLTSVIMSIAQSGDDECYIVPDSASVPEAIGAGPNGQVFTPKGNLKVLTIFAGFNDDASGGVFDEDQALSGWGNPTHPNNPTPILAIPTTLMTDPDKWMYDELNEFGNGVYNLSEFYSEMSMDSFKMYGDILKDPVSNQFVRIDIDPTGTSSWYGRNTKVMNRMQQLYPNFDWSSYDSRTNKPDFQYNNSDPILSPPDFKPDYVVIIYRYNRRWGSQPVLGMQNWTGSGGAYASLNGLSGINYNGYTFDGAGFTMPSGSDMPTGKLPLFVHELAHVLYSCPHQSGVNGTIGNHFSVPSTGWGMMTNTIKINFTANAWERWLLGWIDLTAGADNTDIQTAVDLAPTNGIYTLGDFVRTGDVIRIKIPNSTDQFLWLENHQGLSIFDVKPWEGNDLSPNGELIPPMSKGLYMYKEAIHADRNNVSTGMVYDLNKVNGIKLLNANGNFDYQRSQFAIKDPSWYWNNAVYNFKRAGENQIEGTSNYQNYIDDYPSLDTSGALNDAITYSGNFNGGQSESRPIIRENNGINNVMTYAHIGGVNTEATTQLGRRTDVFITSDEVSLSGIVPAFNYPYYNFGTAQKGTYVINGLSVKVLSENAATGEVTVQVRFDDYEVRNNKRWSGYLSLPPNPNGSSLYALNINSGATLGITKAGSANRHTLNVLNTPNDFINNTVFTCETGAYIHLEQNANIGIGGNSKFILKSGSKIELEAGAELLIHRGELIIEDGAEIILHNGAKITIDEDGILTNNNTVVGKGLIIGDNIIAGNQAEISVRGTLTFASNTFWTHDKAGFYKFYGGYTLNLPASVPVTFTGKSKTYKMLDLNDALTFNGNVVRFANGLIEYQGGAKIKLNINTDMEGIDLTLKGEAYTFNGIAIEADNTQHLQMTSCDYQYLGTGIAISNTSNIIFLISCNYSNISTGVALNNVAEIKILGGSFYGSALGISKGISAINSGIVHGHGVNIQNFVRGGSFENVSGAYFTNSVISNNSLGIYGEDVLIFLRGGTKITQSGSAGIELYGSYDYSGGFYTSMLTMGDAGCASVINNNSGIVGRDFLLNIDALQHAINNGNPNYIFPNRFNDNTYYTFEICYTDPSVSPTQINAKGNFWGTSPPVIPMASYKITSNLQCITKPNHGTDIPLITEDYSTCETNGTCMSCSSGGGVQIQIQVLL